jgi:AcrR family transcriptional regulator
MDTRTKLLIAAERLFALQGLEGVTTRQIIAEAKQRNASALSYHFRTRADLIQAICKYRMESINEDRLERIALYLAEPPKPEDRLRSLITILWLPSLKPIFDSKGKSFFRRFVAHAINSSSVDFSAIIRGKYDTGLRQASNLIHQELTTLPKPVVDMRLATMIRSISYLGSYLESQCATGRWQDREFDLRIDVALMVDAFVGFMQGTHTVDAIAGRRSVGALFL